MKLFLAASSLVLGIIGVAKSALESVPTVNTKEAIELLEDRDPRDTFELLLTDDEGAVTMYRVENIDKKKLPADI